MKRYNIFQHLDIPHHNATPKPSASSFSFSSGVLRPLSIGAREGRTGKGDARRGPVPGAGKKAPNESVELSVAVADSAATAPCEGDEKLRSVFTLRRVKAMRRATA